MKRILANAALFQAGWLAGVLGAANGLWWLGLASLAVVAPLQIRLHADARTAIGVGLVVGVVGAGADIALWGFGVLRLSADAGPAWLFAPWVLGLWINFALTLRVAFRWLEGRPVVCALLGALGGPVTYGAGAKLGAVTLGDSAVASLLIIAGEWALALPLGVWAASRLARRAHADPPPEPNPPTTEAAP